MSRTGRAGQGHLPHALPAVTLGLLLEPCTVPACAACRRCCAGVDVFRRALQLLLLRRRGQQAMAERQEGIPVAPAEREHAEALHIRAADMVVDAGQQLYFLGAISAEQRVVDDEDVPARLARQRCDSLLDDGRVQEQRELAPMDGAGIQED